MKPLLVFILAVASALAAPALVVKDRKASSAAAASTSVATDAPAVTILKQIHQVNDDGTYTFGYENTDGTFRAENKDANGLVTGKYGYIDQNGQLQVLDYVAGSGQSGKSVGYVPTGDSQQLPALLTARTEEVDATPTDPRALDFQYSSVDDDKDGMPDSNPAQRVQQVAVSTTKKPASPIVIQRTQSIRAEATKKTSAAAAIAQRIQEAVNVETTQQPTPETTTLSSLAQRIQLFQAARSTSTTTTTAVPTIRSIITTTTSAPISTSTSTTTTVSPLPSTTTTTTASPSSIVERIVDSVSVDSVAEETPSTAAPVVQPEVVTTPIPVAQQPAVVQLVSPQQIQVVQQRIVNPQQQLVQLRSPVTTTSILSNSGLGFSRMEQFLRDLQIQRLTNINESNQQYFVVDPSNPQQSQFVFLDSDRIIDSLPSYVLGRII